LPEIHDALKRLRRSVARHSADALLISEAYADSVEELIAFYGNGDEMHLPFNFFLAEAQARDASVFRRTVAAVEDACAGRWPSNVLGNHDIERVCDRFREGADPDAVAKLMATLLLTLRGSPFLYYGDEIAMRSDPPATRGEVQDPVGQTFWPQYKGRDGERRPMQWDESPHAGFTTATPWLRVSPDSAVRNVARQAEDPQSVFRYCRQLLHVRRQNPALGLGTYRNVGDDPAVFAYLRETSSDAALVVLNMTDKPQIVRTSVAQREWTIAAATNRQVGSTLGARAELALGPLEAIVFT
jgi:alpha-glucosidase